MRHDRVLGLAAPDMALTFRTRTVAATGPGASPGNTFHSRRQNLARPGQFASSPADALDVPSGAIIVAVPCAEACSIETQQGPPEAIAPSPNWHPISLISKTIGYNRQP